MEKSAFWAADMRKIVGQAFSWFNNARFPLQYTHVTIVVKFLGRSRRGMVANVLNFLHR